MGLRAGLGVLPFYERRNGSTLRSKLTAHLAPQASSRTEVRFVRLSRQLHSPATTLLTSRTTWVTKCSFAGIGVSLGARFITSAFASVDVSRSVGDVSESLPGAFEVRYFNKPRRTNVTGGRTFRSSSFS